MGKDVEKTEKFYLLVKGNYYGTDGDEYLGIYSNLEKLRKAYAKENQKLDTLKKAGSDNYCLHIYEFAGPLYGVEQSVRVVDCDELWSDEDYVLITLSGERELYFESFEIVHNGNRWRSKDFIRWNGESDCVLLTNEFFDEDVPEMIFRYRVCERKLVEIQLWNSAIENLYIKMWEKAL